MNDLLKRKLCDFGYNWKVHNMCMSFQHEHPLWWQQRNWITKYSNIRGKKRKTNIVLRIYIYIYIYIYICIRTMDFIINRRYVCAICSTYLIPFVPVDFFVGWSFRSEAFILFKNRMKSEFFTLWNYKNYQFSTMIFNGNMPHIRN